VYYYYYKINGNYTTFDLFLSMVNLKETVQVKCSLAFKLIPYFFSFY